VKDGRNNERQGFALPAFRLPSFLPASTAGIVSCNAGFKQLSGINEFLNSKFELT